MSLWSQFDCIPKWKRKVIFSGFLIGLGGMLWESHDLIEGRHASSVTARALEVRFDEYGDPYAISRAPANLELSSLWGNPVTIVALTFILALVIGSLIRSLLGGSLTLVGVTIVSVLVVGQGEALAMVGDWELSGWFETIFIWLDQQRVLVMDSFSESLPGALGITAGAILGLFR